MKHMVMAKIVRQTAISSDVRLVEVAAPAIAQEAQPGQFVNVEVSRQAAPLLRRPFGIAGVDANAGTFTMFYRIIGEATHILAQALPGEQLSIIGPLGHGFDLKALRPLLIGGGMGLAPLLYLARSFAPEQVEILIGGRTQQELFWTEIFKPFVRKTYETTDDGSAGIKGLVTAPLPALLTTGSYDCVYVCGPVPMMRSVAQMVEARKIPCQVSLEKYMACGLGACLSCSCQGIGKRLKVCTDGPVFWSREVGEW